VSADEQLEEPDFTKLKKKKTSKKEKKDTEEAEDNGDKPEKPEKADQPDGDKAEDDEEAEYLASLKKKKPKKKDKKAEEGGEAEEGESPAEPGYTYDFLLQRVFTILRSSNPSLAGTKKKYTLKPPNVVRDGTKKCAFTNFKEISGQMNRPTEHLLAFAQTELGTTGSLDGNDCLILRGRFTAKHIESILRKYIAEYVQCTMCHTLDTRLEKDSATRLYSVTCKACGAGRTVQAISSGFAATMKGDRKKARAAGK